jgi:hypothetical protein
METERLGALKRFHDLIGILDEKIGGARTRADCTDRLRRPKRGVYFIEEDGESRSD